MCVFSNVVGKQEKKNNNNNKRRKEYKNYIYIKIVENNKIRVKYNKTYKTKSKKGTIKFFKVIEKSKKVIRKNRECTIEGKSKKRIMQ